MQKEEMREKVRGVIVPVLMPFLEDRSIDFKTLEIFIDWLCQKDISALFPMGGSSEYQTLEIEERKKIIDLVIEVNQKRRIFLAGTGGKSLDETIELSEYAQAKGADGIGVVVPEFIPANESSIYEYYQKVDQAVSFPIMVYDPRGEGGHSVSSALVRRMVDELQNIAGIKYRTTNAEFMGKMGYAIASDIALLSGNECTYLQDLSVGAVGCVGGGGNFYPDLMWELQKNFERNDILKARELQFKMLEATEVLNSVYWPLSGKIVMNELGVPFKFITRVKAGIYSDEGKSAIQNYFSKLLKGA
jgi:4-hydroxy-tetrahydrodipicolinate synthase